MWQRIQTVFLSISAIAALAFLFAPIGIVDEQTVHGKDDVVAAAIAIGIALISLFIITQFKDRKLQLRFCKLNILIACFLLGFTLFAALNNYDTPRYEFAIGIPVLIILSLFFAQRNVKKDDDLVKSMDRFR